MKTTSIVFIVFLLMKGCVAFGQSDSDIVLSSGKITMGAYNEVGNLVWDSSITTSIGEKFFRFQAKNISQDGEFAIQIYMSDGSLAQYTFYNGYRLRDEFWWHGKKIDDSKHDEIYKYFKLKK